MDVEAVEDRPVGGETDLVTGPEVTDDGELGHLGDGVRRVGEHVKDPCVGAQRLDLGGLGHSSSLSVVCL